MPSEDELREQFHGGGQDGGPGREVIGAIDLDAVIRRSRARRRPRVAAVAIVSSLAVLGVVVPVSISAASSHTTTSVMRAGSAAAPDAGGEASGPTGAAPIFTQGLNHCGGALSIPAPAADGLVLTVQPVDAAADARDIPVTVTLTNTGADEVAGSLSPFPTLTLSRDGVVLWHSNGAVPSLAQQLDLAPGASTTFESTFEPVVCAAEDDTPSGFRSDLPAAGPGDYQLSAALDFSPQGPGADGGTRAVLVTGPTSPVTLH